MKAPSASSWLFQESSGEVTGTTDATVRRRERRAHPGRDRESYFVVSAGAAARSTGAEAATTFWANAFCEASSFSAKPNEFETTSFEVGRSAAMGSFRPLVSEETLDAQSSTPASASSWPCLIVARICSCALFDSSRGRGHAVPFRCAWPSAFDSTRICVLCQSSGQDWRTWPGRVLERRVRLAPERRRISLLAGRARRSSATSPPTRCPAPRVAPASHSSGSAGRASLSQCLRFGPGRVDDPGDVPRGGEHEPHRPACELGRAVAATPRRDVVLAGGDHVEVGLALASETTRPAISSVPAASRFSRYIAWRYSECIRAGIRVASAFHARMSNEGGSSPISQPVAT